MLQIIKRIILKSAILCVCVCVLTLCKIFDSLSCQGLLVWDRETCPASVLPELTPSDSEFCQICFGKAWLGDKMQSSEGHWEVERRAQGTQHLAHSCRC